MTEPEIARRCSSCGASIREKAFFCPQCGAEIKQGSEAETASLHETQEIVRDAVTLTEADFQARQKPRPPNTPEKSKPAPVDVPREKPRGQVTQRAKEQVGASIHRATTKARDVEGNVAQRVQKFRELSSVVIDEAGYDPSLRFVLVAAVLFILFIVIVLLNKMIG
jgi:zinc-ribbon domain